MQPDTLIASAIATHDQQSGASNRHFSAFPNTSHLHNAAVRLVSLHPFLSLTVTFLRVPEIHDDYEFKIFLSCAETVAEAIQRIVGELGLTRSLPIPGAGNLEYVMDEVWADGKQESMFKNVPLQAPCQFVFRILQAPWLDVCQGRVKIPFLPQSLQVNSPPLLSFQCPRRMV